MKKYDFIFGIGRDSSCSTALRQAGLQFLSLPWDNIDFNGENDASGLDVKLKIVESGFKDGFREKGFLPNGLPLREADAETKAKYDRRVERFIALMKESTGCVLVVYVDSPAAANADVGKCQEAQKRLQALYPHVKVDFLMLSLDCDRPFSERTVEDLGDGFTRVSFNFRANSSAQTISPVDLSLCAAAMRSIASVRDYKGSGKSKARRTLREKMRMVGAQNIWQYFLYRRRSEFSRLLRVAVPRMLLARLRRKKYDHVLSIGMNCEPAFRFALSWGFVESTPFSWASIKNPLQLAEALRHPEQIGSKGFSLRAKNLMWECEMTGISFHGKLIADSDGAILDPKALEEDKADLVQRLSYLNGKFTRILSDDSSKAIIFRVDTQFVLAPDANELIDTVQRALEERGARNYVLAVVVEQAVRGKISSASNRVVRAVKKFNPRSAVTDVELGDSAGWRALYSEFTPKTILPKKHAFKFEKH